MSDLTVRIASLYVHPVKSCAGVSPAQALLSPTGLQHDRRWMIVTPDGQFVTQRQLPRMALIRTALEGDGLRLDAPGLPSLRPAPHAAGRPCRVTVWKDEVAARDLGDEAAAWLAQALGQSLRLVAFEPEQPPRLSSRDWTGDLQAPNHFSDGFPVLVTSTAGLQALNRRLAERGIAPVGMERFRPNLVLDGLEDANGEDFIDELRFETAEGPVVLKLVKPCVRCTIPSVDPRTGEQGTEPGDTLSSYRADSRMGGGITFGMNAVIVEGVGRTLAVGMPGEASLAF
ncbi:MOSC domain-containing protein [Ideonella sp. BN130291]|uniref:MOSC domain-containing protein n=1 Tax=Ideonella sp. BN130291 TaxID=3112940 RepID=UPI002E26D133|nr:MOSC N-terminal beta barrel domain-containing protein [Ideonella sp. BN130291]